ncbi:hypothetical protein GH714_003354 [Hevea brasiliensis]|uniref:Rubber elongation factor n=3 Tax=Hevea brasiliensis TaxID=3981 RepID=A0A6A6LW75_HEVBR|nr:hypothetical protein GH714_003354 [Hevea brasiliensis]
MAEDEDNQQGQGEGLKYLGFVQDAATYAVTTFSNVYLFAKDKSGPLQPGVDIIEGPVKNVAVPLYNRFSYIPNGALKFVDSTFDASIAIIDRRVPPIFKQASTQTYLAARDALGTSHAMASNLPLPTKRLSRVLYGDKLIGEEPKVLDFVQTATVYARLLSQKLYLFAKDKSGPFKPGINTVESRFKSVVRPVYNKFEPVPNKVDAYVTVLDRIVPPIVKQASIQAYSVAPGATRAVASYLPLHTKSL